MLEDLMKLIEKDRRKIIGLMSGTSADGLDIAFVKLEGSGLHLNVELIKAYTYEYDEDFKRKITDLYDPRKSTVDFICEMNFLIAERHADFVLKFLKEENLNFEDIDCIAYHGQTIYHLPYGGRYGQRSTFQIGEMDVISHKTGFITIGDFRKKDIAAGGQGAPLVSYMDYVLYRNEDKSISVHNLGGISNLTYLPRGCLEKDVIAFDTGPANALIDSVAEHFFDTSYDKDGRFSSCGNVDNDLFQELIRIDGGYFEKKPPKTTGKEVYNLEFVLNALNNVNKKLKPEDVIRTVVFFTAWHIFQNYLLHVIPHGLDIVLFSGGGTKNPTLMGYIKKFLGKYGIDIRIDDRFGKFKEAVCMALMAHEFLNGKKNNIPSATGAEEEVICGKLSLP